MIARRAAITVLDFETTGAVRGHPNEPWQVAMVELRDGAVTGRHWHSYLRIAPGRPFNPYAPGRHAELRETLALAPSFADVFPAWRPWIEHLPLAAHGVGTEKKFLRRAAPLHRLGPWIDTLKLARRVRPDLQSHSLADVAQALGLVDKTRALCPGCGWHDALFDAFAAALVLEACLALPGWDGVSVEALG
jgi:DNA polymerase III subunit epsilon